MADVDTQEDNQDFTQDSQPPGEMLAQAREAKDLSRVQVSELLGLTAAVIRDIELSRFERFPSGIYARGYIRNYCKLVGLDEDTVLSSYDRFAETNPVPDESPFGSNLQLNQDSGNGLKLGIGIGIAAVVVVLIVFFVL